MHLLDSPDHVWGEFLNTTDISHTFQILATFTIYFFIDSKDLNYLYCAPEGQISVICTVKTVAILKIVTILITVITVTQ